MEDWNWETIFTDIISLHSSTVTYLASKEIEFGEKRKERLLRRWRSFEVIEVGTNRKPVWDFLLVIKSNWQPISYRCGVQLIVEILDISGQFWKFCVFEPPFGGLRDNIRCSSWAHWKARSGLPISVNGTFFARCYGWDATGKNRSKIGDFAPTRSVWPKISRRRRRPHQ